MDHFPNAENFIRPCQHAQGSYKCSEILIEDIIKR